MPNFQRLPAALLALVAMGPVSAAAQSSSAPNPMFGEAVSDQSLQAIAGREDTNQIATNAQTAGVSRNSVGDNVQTGDARIADNAFQNLSGLSILNVNTGNNVAINAAMSVNIALHPGP